MTDIPKGYKQSISGHVRQFIDRYDTPLSLYFAIVQSLQWRKQTVDMAVLDTVSHKLCMKMGAL